MYINTYIYMYADHFHRFALYTEVLQLVLSVWGSLCFRRFGIRMFPAFSFL